MNYELLITFVYYVSFVFESLLKRPVGPEDTQPNGKRSDALGCREHQDGGRLVKAKAFTWGHGQSYMTKLLPLQGAPLLSVFSLRVSLRSALGYVLTALSGRTSSASGVSEPQRNLS